jgi:DNA polymerase delta subunit 1
MPQAVIQIDVVEKASIFHYHPDKSKFLKIYVAHPKVIPQLRGAFERGFEFRPGMDVLSTITYESNLPYALRFMIDNEIGGMMWVKIEKKNWVLRSPQKYVGNCQIEFDVPNFNHVTCLPCEGKYSKIAPVRIMSFDIECSAGQGKFPTPKEDPVIQIANIVKI